MTNLPREPRRRQMTTDGVGSLLCQMGNDPQKSLQNAFVPRGMGSGPPGDFGTKNLRAFALKTPKTHCKAETMWEQISDESDASQWGKNCIYRKGKGRGTRPGMIPGAISGVTPSPAVSSSHLLMADLSNNESRSRKTFDKQLKERKTRCERKRKIERSQRSQWTFKLSDVRDS